METAHRMHWVPDTSARFDFYNDHHNPIFWFDHLAVVPRFSQMCLRKALRYAARLSTYNISWFHIKNLSNDWEIIWTRGEFAGTIRRLVNVLVLHFSSSYEFCRTTLPELPSTKSAFCSTFPNIFDFIEGLRSDAAGMWVPKDAGELQSFLRVFLIPTLPVIVSPALPPDTSIALPLVGYGSGCGQLCPLLHSLLLNLWQNLSLI